MLFLAMSRPWSFFFWRDVCEFCCTNTCRVFDAFQIPERVSRGPNCIVIIAFGLDFSFGLGYANQFWKKDVRSRKRKQ